MVKFNAQKLAQFAFALAILAGGGVAKAGLIGSSVDVAAYFPQVSQLFQDGGAQIVSSSIEYPIGTFSKYNPTIEVDISDGQFILTMDGNAGIEFQPTPFNGFILTMLSGPTLLDAIANSASAFFPTVSIENGNKLLLNYSGVNLSSTSSRVSSIIDIRTGTAVPEPTTLALLAVGFAILVLGMRTRSRCAAI